MASDQGGHLLLLLLPLLIAYAESEHPAINCLSPSVANGMMISGNGTSYRPTDSVRFACRDGFDLTGPKEIACGPDGQWDPQPPQCLPSTDRGCGPPASYPNMHPIGIDLAQRLFPPKSRVAYQCAIGYMRTLGTRISECKDGHWTRIYMKCQRKVCGSAGEILNGRYNYEGVEFGDKATAVCNQGYELIGRPYRHCLEMGWDGRDPVCEAVQCDEPPSVVDAEWSGPIEDMFPYRTVVTYQCLRGQLIGNSQIHCTHKGRWSSKAPMCQDITCSSPNVRNGEKTSGFQMIYKYGDSVSFRCLKGFVLEGSSSVTCNVNGKWKPAQPKCTKIKCPQIKVENGTLSSNRVAVGHTITIKCRKNFSLQGAQKVSCLPSGSWNAIIPKCVLKPRPYW
ncbi:complement receptor type 2-like isoform X2 [Brienomyrus brachyistius]|uniref:complement receptor type 2-like isoform X2 n=1 Tax=Brienomyrus brachyistius TaxID=42636 RepID=UPI0020B3BE1D|nr:complement receptor type 2-like isoform X2 [Brienomyrus brachyistius]